MKAAPAVKTIRNGPLSLVIRHYSDGRFGFDFGGANDRRKIRAKTLEAAEQKGREMIAASQAGKVSWMEVDPVEWLEFQQWKASRLQGCTVPDAVAKMLANKETKGRSFWTLQSIRSALEPFAKRFPGRLERLTRAEVETWLDSLGVGARRWNNVLASIIALFRFARRDGAIGAELSPVERIEKRKVLHSVGTYTPNEFARIIDATEPEWLPAVILGGLCGLRPEEICPDTRGGKRALQWEDFAWSKGVIDLPREVSKVNRRRFVPLCESAQAFLGAFTRESGPVVPRSRISNKSRYWSSRSGVPWIRDGLRHSYASYRLALIHDVPRLALEMGNSVKVCFDSYLDLKHADEAEKWFAIRPKVPSRPIDHEP